MSPEGLKSVSRESHGIAAVPELLGQVITSLRRTFSGRALQLALVALQLQSACNTQGIKPVNEDIPTIEVTSADADEGDVNSDAVSVDNSVDPTKTTADCPQDPLYDKFKELNLTLDQCKGCHRPGGIGYQPDKKIGWEWDGSGNPIASEKSFHSLYAKAARFDSNNEPYWISHAKGKDHGGGAQPLDNGQVSQMKAFTNLVRDYVAKLGGNPDVDPLPAAPKVNVDCNNAQYTKEDLFKNMEMLSYAEVYTKFLRNVTGSKLPTTPVKITSKDQLRQMLMLATEDPGFYEWLRTNFNDKTLTRALAKDDKAKKALGTAYGIDWSTRDNAELADSPGNLLVYVTKHNLSAKLLGTATFVIDPGIKPPAGAVDDFVGRMKAINISSNIVPLAGVPSDRIWLSRWPSSKTNINRNRSRLTHLEFFDMDITKFGNSNAQQADPNEQWPTLVDENCISCHRGTPLDLGSRAFTNFDITTGEYKPIKEPLPISLLNMGLYGQTMEHNKPNALQQLMYLMTLDPDLSPSDPGYDPERRRPYAQSWVKKIYSFLMQRAPSEKPNAGEMDLEAKNNRYLAEKTGLINPMVDFFHDNGHNLRKLVVEMAMSEWYAATGEMTDDAELSSQREIELANVGPTLATPEQFLMRLKSFLGKGVEKFGLSILIKGPANTELGGIDSEIVITRQTDPTSASELRLDSIALANVSQIVIDELAKVPNDRHWAMALPAWDVLKENPPVDLITKEENKAVALKYKQTMAIILLHRHGRYFEVNSPEVQALFDEWVSIWEDCMSAPGGDNIVTPFQINGVDSSDKLKIIQAWMALITEVVQSIEFTTTKNDESPDLMFEKIVASFRENVARI